MTRRNSEAGPGAPSRSDIVQSRRAARRQAAISQQRRSLALRIGLVIAAVVVVAAGFVAIARGRQQAPLPAGTQSFSNLGRDHATGKVAYDQVPPVGGTHAAVVQNCGFYTAPVANENAVHSLEHGSVWITYRPDLPSDQVDRLKALAGQQSHILVSPLAANPAPVVATAWGRQLRLDSATDNRLTEFVQRFRLGSQAPEPGAACSGGTSATTS